MSKPRPRPTGQRTLFGIDNLSLDYRGAMRFALISFESQLGKRKRANPVTNSGVNKLRARALRFVASN